MESTVNKSFEEGMQDTTTAKPANNWFGASPRPIPGVAGEGVSRLRADRGACKGSTDTPTPKGATLKMAETLKLKHGGSAKRSYREG